MQIIPVTRVIPDIADVPQINRFTDGVNYYVIESDADYDLLPDAVKIAAGLAAESEPII